MDEYIRAAMRGRSVKRLSLRARVALGSVGVAVVLIALTALGAEAFKYWAIGRIAGAW